ncbi:MAG TPA: hypothetical protein VK540_25095 [Polyangiaceae bacterium]|nr:hypothetical protein [Polyangiaceae bacterium]
MQHGSCSSRHAVFVSALGLCIAPFLAACGGESTSGGDATSQDSGATDTSTEDPHFSFFVTSLAALQSLSGRPQGFGGDLRFGQSDGLSGADEICRQISLQSMPGNEKTWRAFLSVTKGPGGESVNAIDRIGQGPWYDRLGRVVALNKTDLAQTRPRGADAAIANDLPNEHGIPNHNPDGTGNVDNHDMLTGTNANGTLHSMNWSATCHDWTSSVGADGRPRCGHPWPTGGSGGGPGGMIFDGGFRIDGGFPIDGGFRVDGGIRPPGFDGGPTGDLSNWMSSLDESGCAPGVNLIETGPPNPSHDTVGSGGGYGGFYCFALSP